MKECMLFHIFYLGMFSKKIALIGLPGSGKSTFAARLGRVFIFHIKGRHLLKVDDKDEDFCYHLSRFREGRDLIAIEKETSNDN